MPEPRPPDSPRLPSPTGRRSPWHQPRGPPQGVPPLPAPRPPSPVVIFRPPLGDCGSEERRGSGPTDMRGPTPNSRASSPALRAPSPAEGRPVTEGTEGPSRALRHARHSGDGRGHLPVASAVSDPGALRGREVWLSLVHQDGGLWCEDGPGAALCRRCAAAAQRAYDGPFQLAARIRREQLVQGALQDSIAQLRDLCIGDVPLDEVLGQHWAQLRLQFDIINVLLETQAQPTGNAHLQEIRKLLAEFKQRHVERMDHYRACPPTASREALRTAVMHLSADNRRLLEDAEMLHSANTLLEADIQLLSTQLEKYVRKAARSASRAAPESPSSEALQKELTATQDQCRRLKAERDVLAHESHMLRQDNNELREKGDQLWDRLQKTEIQLLAASSNASDAARLVPELRAANDQLWRQIAALQAELAAARAQAEEGLARGRSPSVPDPLDPPGTAERREDAALRRQLEAERERRAVLERRLADDNRELEALRQEAVRLQVDRVQLSDTLKAKDTEVQTLRRRLETAGPADSHRIDRASAASGHPDRDQLFQDLLDQRSRCVELETKVLTLQNELRSVRRTADLQTEQLTGTLETLALKETQLTEAQAALHQAKRQNRDQQWELKSLREELQMRRNRSGRSTPVGAPNQLLSVSPARPGLRASSPAPLASSVASILKGYRALSASRSDAGLDTADLRGPRRESEMGSLDSVADVHGGRFAAMSFDSNPLEGRNSPSGLSGVGNDFSTQSLVPVTLPLLEAAEDLRSTDDCDPK